MVPVPAGEFQQMQQMLHHLMQQQNAQATAAAAAAAANAARPKLLKIPSPSSFRGESGFRVDEWIRELERQFAYYDRELNSDADRIRFATAFMQDLASQWWADLVKNNQQAQPRTWDQFVAALHARFRPLESALVARQTLERLEQGKLSVDQYAHRFQAVLTSIDDMSEADKVYRFIANLRNGLKQKVLQEGHKTLREAIQAAGSHEAAWRFSRPANSQPFQRFAPHSRGDASGSSPMDINNVESKYDEEEDDSFDSSASSKTAADSVLSALVAKLERMDQRINAVVQQRRGGFGQRRSNDLVPGLTAEQVAECLRKGLCLFCQKHGHMKRDCPERNQKPIGRQGK
jgi:hypothetical protein